MHCSTLLFAGFETTTYAISRILWMLASRPEAQARLRSEIRDAKRRLLSEVGVGSANDRWEDVALSYDQLMASPYLDAIIRETLRVHPPSSVHFRECVERYLSRLFNLMYLTGQKSRHLSRCRLRYALLKATPFPRFP